MKTVVFQGGLGNQIFQYFFYKYVEERIDHDVRYIDCKKGNNHNGFEILNYFAIEMRKAPWYIQLDFRIRELFKFRGPFSLKESGENEIKTTKQKYYVGYWQNKRFFEDSSIEFKKLTLSERNNNVLKEILNTNSIAIHVRRGDYLYPQYVHIYGGICTIDYYQKALDICIGKMPKPSFFIFSDDIAWTKKNLEIEGAVYISWNNGDDSIFDLYLMSHAKAIIMANSTFSFWGAYINNPQKLVVYPKKWYNSVFQTPDIFPKEWLGI